MVYASGWVAVVRGLAWPGSRVECRGLVVNAWFEGVPGVLACRVWGKVYSLQSCW